jgi:hypothetical protein
MKLADCFLVSFLALTGCQVTPRPATPPAVARLPVVTTALAPAARTPEFVKTYTLGAYVDDDDPTVRHAGHTIQRIERAATWDLRPVEKPAPEPIPPASLPTEPTITPPTDPVAAVVNPVSAPSQIATLPPGEPTPPATPVAQPVESPPQAAVAMPADSRPILSPNAEGLVDFSALAASTDDEINPFAVRAAAESAVREISLTISGVFLGPAPTAIVNSRPLTTGETFEGLTLERIETTAALFGAGAHRVRLPVAPTAYRLRFAP